MSNDLIDAERFRLLLDDPRISVRVDDALERLKTRGEAARAKLDGYPENKAEVTYAKGGVTISLIRNDSMAPTIQPFYCGYVRFPQKMLQSELFTKFIPVHGGISFDHGDTDGSHVYGFDCCHAGDVDTGTSRFRDIEAVKAECERLATAIDVAAKWEKDFLSCPDGVEWRGRRISAIERCHSELRKRGIPFDLTDNFGALLAALFGEI